MWAMHICMLVCAYGYACACMCTHVRVHVCRMPLADKKESGACLAPVACAGGGVLSGSLSLHIHQ